MLPKSQMTEEDARMLDVPFAYSSNGDAFYERDFLPGKERALPPDQRPSPEELMERCRKGAGLSVQEAAMIHQPYDLSAMRAPAR